MEEYIDGKTKKWGALVHEGISKLISLPLTATDYQIFFQLCFVMNETTNIANVNQKSLEYLKGDHKSINKEKSKDKSTISKSINKLILYKVIKRFQGGFMINPDIYYFGGNWKNLYSLRSDFFKD